jgi:ubiquinone/menaquinone biosynthesis C-methylase UbiE
VKEKPYSTNNDNKVDNSNKMAQTVPQVESSFYFQKKIDTKGQFVSYWHQINEIFSLKPQSTLEIGKGSAFVSSYLKKRGVNIRTLDIVEELKPDVVGSVFNLPFKNSTFEVVACFEVLEHLPYENFKISLHEIFRVCKKYAVISLPQNIKKTYRIFISIPRTKGIKKIFNFPNWRKPTRPFSKEHYWELGTKGFPLSRIKKDILKAGFEIEKTYRVFEKLFHRFFILKKVSQ